MEIIREKGPFVTVEEGEKIRVGLSASMRAPGLIDSFNLRATRQPWSPYADPGLFAMSGSAMLGLLFVCIRGLDFYSKCVRFLAFCTEYSNVCLQPGPYVSIWMDPC